MDEAIVTLVWETALITRSVVLFRSRDFVGVCKVETRRDAYTNTGIRIWIPETDSA